ncbi:hypothetical protein [Peribacillus frigoritolerans]|uniref:hypothetical protein n=1 Tax=Peribacillus frigoritolerans TaxID=450367 RepID=UPI0032E443C3
MNYKVEFLQRINEIHVDEIAEKRRFKLAKEQALLTINNYFESLFENLGEAASASKLFQMEDHLHWYKIKFAQNSFLNVHKYPDVSKVPDKIKVELGCLGTVWEDSLSYKDGRYVSRKYKMDLNEALLDEYLKEAFDKYLSKY